MGGGAFNGFIDYRFGAFIDFADEFIHLLESRVGEYLREFEGVEGRDALRTHAEAGSASGAGFWWVVLFGGLGIGQVGGFEVRGDQLSSLY
jgi:hypothetical protein